MSEAMRMRTRTVHHGYVRMVVRAREVEACYTQRADELVTLKVEGREQRMVYMGR